MLDRYVDNEAVRFTRAVLIAFVGALGWFIWAAAGQTNSSCFGSSHYVPSAAIALGVVVGLEVALEVFIWSFGQGPPVWRQECFYVVVGGAVATAVLTAVGLLIGEFFAGVVGCSA
jgi:hypothetical protein